jgi:hypothetical protein
MGDTAYNVLAGGSRHRLYDNIKMDFKEIGWEGVDWSHLAENRDQWWALVGTVICLPSDACGFFS